MSESPWAWDDRYRLLREGEAIRATDQYDINEDRERDPPTWVRVPPHMVGRKASDPTCIAHTRYRRLAGVSAVD